MNYHSHNQSMLSHSCGDGTPVLPVRLLESSRRGCRRWQTAPHGLWRAPRRLGTQGRRGRLHVGQSAAKGQIRFHHQPCPAELNKLFRVRQQSGLHYSPHQR